LFLGFAKKHRARSGKSEKHTSARKSEVRTYDLQASQRANCVGRQKRKSENGKEPETKT